MTRTKRLVHLIEGVGPLSIAQLLEISGWPRWALERAIARLMKLEVLTPTNINGKRHYAMWQPRARAHLEATA